MRLRWVLVFALIASAVLVTTVLRDRTPVRSEYCSIKVGKLESQIDLEQAQWAALMAAIGIRRGLPPRATTIAIATAFQESKIHNIDYGDRDSVGLFQQRPSQGWGRADQILDPHYSIGKFYDALVKIKGYDSMEITVAAQRVQRSAYAGAYAQHEDYARAIASALTGYSPAGFTCQVSEHGKGSIAAVDKDVQSAFGRIESTHGKDRISYPQHGTKANRNARGWALAHYLVANAAHLKISGITFDGRSWDLEDSPKGWTKASGVSSSTVKVMTN